MFVNKLVELSGSASMTDTAPKFAQPWKMSKVFLGSAGSPNGYTTWLKLIAPSWWINSFPQIND